jgi:hypothetical protein
MSQRAFSERVANQFLQKVLHAPLHDETAAMLAKDWRAVIEANFTFTPDQRRVLDAVPPDGSELIQSTLATVLNHRGRASARGLKLRFAEAPPTQTRPVEIRVERAEGVGANAAHDTDARTEEIPFELWVILVAGMVVLGCVAQN